MSIGEKKHTRIKPIALSHLDVRPAAESGDSGTVALKGLPEALML